MSAITEGMEGAEEGECGLVVSVSSQTYVPECDELETMREIKEKRPTLWTPS